MNNFIQKIELTNFRKFERFAVTFQAGNILVGPNNCGKSSILDAIRLLDACYRFTRNKNPTRFRIPTEGFVFGYEIPERLLPFRLANITRNYSADDAIVEVTLNSGAIGVIRLHPEHQTRFYIRLEGDIPRTSGRYRAAFPIDIVVVPTLSPLEEEEEYVEDATVQRNSGTRLASRVLRNIWLRRSEEEFASFRADIEGAWEKIQIRKPEMIRVPDITKPIVQMFYAESRIEREVQWAGFGFQVWLQIQTHIRRGNTDSILVIDEPDIYLHPDLQRRLLIDARNKCGQYLMATHAVEIINEANSNEIISINAENRTGRRIRSDKDYSSLFQYLGSAENIDFARIAKTKRVIFVEGRDGKLLRRFAIRFGLKSLADPQGAPIVELGGFTEWRRAVHAVWAFRKMLDLEIKAFCIFDRDYRSGEEVAAFLKEMSTQDFTCVVLDRKEIENYLLAPNAIALAIQKRLKIKGEGTNCTPKEAEELLFKLSGQMKLAVQSRQTAELVRHAETIRSPQAPATLIHKHVTEFEEAWNTFEARISFSPGKELLSRFNEAIQNRLRTSLTDAMIVSAMNQNDVPTSFMKLLNDLDRFSKS